MRILVCGGRDFTDKKAVFAALNRLNNEFGFTTLIFGDARGVDSYAHEWAIKSGFPYEPYFAEWLKYGLSAGPRRNQRMLDEGKPDLVIAFPGGKGTADMVRRAKSAGIEVLELKHESTTA